MQTYAELAPQIERVRRTVWTSLTPFERSLLEGLATEMHVAGCAVVDPLTAQVLAKAVSA